MSDTVTLPRADVERLMAELKWLRQDNSRLRARVYEFQQARDAARRQRDRLQRLYEPRQPEATDGCA